MRDKPTPLPVKILDDGPFIQVPRFWTSELMGSHSHYAINGKRTKQGECIPASFWKYLFYLWGWIMNGNPERTTTQSMREFPVRRDAAVRWTAALSVSGLFDIEIGKYTAAHDKPTSYRYNVNATQQEWLIFITALDFALTKMRHSKKTGADTVERCLADGANTGAFKLYLAIDVDAARVKAGLPAVNRKFIDDAVNGKIKDIYGRPIAKRDDKDGEIIFSTSRRSKNMHIKGHTRICDCTDCFELRREMRDDEGPQHPW